MNAYSDRAAREDEEDRLRLVRAARDVLTCPDCGEPIWDLPHGHKLAKCWNAEGHDGGGPLAFDTMTEEDD